jgi:16S rRNA processing protein RimM
VPSCPKAGWHFYFTSMEIQSSLKIGFILKPHGLKGEVTVSLDEGSGIDMKTLEFVFVEKNSQLIPHFITTISINGQKAFVKFEDVDSLEAAEEISRQGIYVEKPARPKSKRGEYYNDEVIGFDVYDEAAGLIGVVQLVVEEGPNPMLVLDRNGNEVLIPLNSPFIVDVDKRKKCFKVNLPEGFLDI